MAAQNDELVTVRLTEEHLRKMVENRLLEKNELGDQSKKARVVEKLIGIALDHPDRPWHDWDDWGKGLDV
jgi:hypothetical protein